MVIWSRRSMKGSIRSEFPCITGLLIFGRHRSDWNLNYYTVLMAVEPVLNCVRYFTSQTFFSSNSMFVCNLKYHWLTRRTCADVIRAFKLSPEKQIWRRCECSFVSIIRNSRRHSFPEIVRNKSLEMGIVFETLSPFDKTGSILCSYSLYVFSFDFQTRNWVV